MTGRRRRAVAIAAAAALATVGAAAPVAHGEDDPSAYTDPAPRPVQEEQAVEQVEQALSSRGVETTVTPTEVRTGVVVEVPAAVTIPDAAERAVVSPANGVPLSAAGLEPSLRAGVTGPASATSPDGVLAALLAVLVAATAGILALRRR